MERNESKKRQHSSHTKTKYEFELPKINRTTVTINKNSNLNNKENSYIFHQTAFESRLTQASYVQKVNWVIEEVDYSAWNDQQISNEYDKLRKQLNRMNQQVVKALQKINFKALRKPKRSEPDSMKTLEIRDRQIDNNNAILQRLKKQYHNLQRRVSSINQNTKDNIEHQIEECKEKIAQTKIKIKDLKMKNKSVGDRIVNTDKFFDDIKKLQMEKEAQQRKKYKLQCKSEHVVQQIAACQLKNQEINDDFLIAQNYFQEFHGKEQVQSEKKALEKKISQTKHCLDVTLKKNQILNSTKQQKYHNLLKNLENQVSKINFAGKKTCDLELEIIQKKKLIIQLEELLNQKEGEKKMKEFGESPIFFTEFQENTAEKQKQSHLEKTMRDNEIEDLTLQLEVQETSEKKQKPDNSEKIRTKERLSTNLAELQQEEKDIMGEIDQKFKYGPAINNKSHKLFGSSSRYSKNRAKMNSDIQTQLGENQSSDIGGEDSINEEDQQIIQFKSKISEQKQREKGKNLEINLDLQKVEENIRSYDISSAEKIKSKKWAEIPKQNSEQQDIY